MGESVKKVSVSMADKDIAIVKEKAIKSGLNFSSALRLIVREWEEIKLLKVEKGGEQDIDED